MNSTISPDQLFGDDVYDNAGNKIGSVDNVWVDDATNETEFIGVKTGWFMGQTHLIPTADAQFNDDQITVPYGQDQVKDAPSFDSDHELSPDEENQIYSYYGLDRTTSASPSGLSTDQSGTGTLNTDTTDTYATDTTDTYADTNTAPLGENQQVTLSEEELQVGTRQVEAGTVRLRKVVNTEHQEVPVELRREEVEIERVDATDADLPSDAFQNQEVDVQLMREEPVIAKEAHVTGAVRVNKDVQTETRTVGADVRTEDVEIDRDIDTPEYSRSATGGTYTDDSTDTTNTDSTNY